MKFFKNKKYIILSFLPQLSLIFVIVFSVLLSSQFSFVQAEDNIIQIETGIQNPLGDNFRDIPSFIEKVIEIVLFMGIPLLALAIIYSGFMFIEAQGNKDKLEKAKKNLMYVLIGGVLLLGAFVISDAIVNTVEDIKNGAN